MAIMNKIIFVLNTMSKVSANWYLGDNSVWITGHCCSKDYFCVWWHTIIMISLAHILVNITNDAFLDHLDHC